MSQEWSFFSTAGDDLKRKQNIPINQLMHSLSTQLFLHAFIILPARSADWRMKEDSASLRKAGAALHERYEPSEAGVNFVRT